MNSLYLIATLCMGTTSYELSKSSEQTHGKFMLEARNIKCNEAVYKLSAIETWYCKYFGHRWIKTLPDYIEVTGGVIFSRPATYFDSDKAKTVPGMICSICNEPRKRTWRTIQREERVWEWE